MTGDFSIGQCFPCTKGQGSISCTGEFLEPVGMGALQLAFEQMKEKLAAEGLFDADYKREIPENVGCIAVITSPTGAAVRDIIQIAKRRDPRVKLAIFPTLVRGRRRLRWIL